MGRLDTFHLPVWLEGNVDNAQLVLGGSAAPSLSLDDLIALSSDPETTKRALNVSSLKLASHAPQGSLALRKAIVELYNKDISPEQVVTAIGTTGSNLTAFSSLLQPGDHVIGIYPTYPQLLALPKALGCDMSYWRLAPDNGWQPDIEELRNLIKPSTKMIILNNPINPTGTHLDQSIREEILELARKNDIIVFVDEIFRPLYHDGSPTSSFVEQGYEKVVVTSSMSKVWGMSGVRLGWIVSRDPGIIQLIMNARQYTLQSTSVIDEVIATEALSSRCRHTILKRHLDYARQNLAQLETFVKKNSDMCSWTPPTAAATAFIKLARPNGEALDDAEFCSQILKEKGLLLTPGNLGFSNEAGQTNLKGYLRIQFTLAPDYLRESLEVLDSFLQERRMNGT